MWISRLSGLVLALAGLALLLYLGHALYTRSSHGLVVLVGLGMPVVLFGVLAGASLLGCGVWLIGSARQADRTSVKRS
jgi:asparagine N-glycosylation enzyme membrane subunit Stt3